MHRAAGRIEHIFQKGRNMGDARKQNGMERPIFPVMFEQKVVNMGLGHFGGVARVDGSVLAAFLPQFLARIIAEDDAPLTHPQRFQIRAPKGGR